jgi:hypothetical protein
LHVWPPDKQPEFTGWRKDLGPWTPNYENGLLYGRSGAPTTAAVYASLTAIMALDAGHTSPAASASSGHLRESGSFDLPAYIDVLKTQWSRVSLVVCLDSGAGNYDRRLWLTTSLRGMVSGTLR